MNYNTANCTNCRNYTTPVHEGNLFCAVNPQNKNTEIASDCQKHDPIITNVDDILGKAMIKRQQEEFEKWRSQVLSQAEMFGVEIRIQEPEYADNWLVPNHVIKGVKSQLPLVLKEVERVGLSLSVEDVAIAMMNYIETKMSHWCVFTSADCECLIDQLSYKPVDLIDLGEDPF